MPRPQHDRQRQRKQNQQDDQGQGDAEAAAGLGGVQGWQGRRDLGLGLALVAREHLALVQRDCPGVGPQVTTDEDVCRQHLELVVLELEDDANGNASRLRNFGDRDLALLSLPFQIAAE